MDKKEFDRRFKDGTLGIGTATVEDVLATKDGLGAQLTLKAEIGAVTLTLPEPELLLLMTMVSAAAGDLLSRRKQDLSTVNAFRTDWWDVRLAEDDGLVFTFRIVGVGMRMSFLVSKAVAPRIIEAIRHAVSPQPAPPGEPRQ